MSKRLAGEPVQQEKTKRTRRPDEIAIKFLLPDVVVGALLSKKAAALKRIRDQTGHYKDFVLKLSAKGQFYPGTKDERMVALAGPPQLIHRACCLLQDQIIDDPYLVLDESGTNDAGPRQGQMKLIVSDRAASKIIGSRGSVVKDISRHFNIVIAITQSKDIIVPDERLVTIIGPSRNVFDSLEPIIYQIAQQDTHVETDFEYYEQYNKPKPTEVVEEKSSEEPPSESQETVTENSTSDGSKVAPEEVMDAEKETECVDEKEAEEKSQKEEETKADDEETKVEEEETKAEEKEGNTVKEDITDSAKSEVNDDVTETVKNKENEANEDKEEKKDDKGETEKKKLEKQAAKKDGRWVWQTDSLGKPLWVWVDSKKDPPYANRTRGW